MINIKTNIIILNYYFPNYITSFEYKQIYINQLEYILSFN